MTSTLVDTNILLDIATGDPVWSEWSSSALRYARSNGELVINAIVFSEISSAFTRIEEVDQFLDDSSCRREDLPWASAFVAGQAFRQYRRRGGIKSSTLPDFLIGAHALVLGYALLTRDRAQYKSYFPSLHLLSPTGA
jgi:hypothetical protein